MPREFGPNNMASVTPTVRGPWIDSYTHLTTDWEGTKDGIRHGTGTVSYWKKRVMLPTCSQTRRSASSRAADKSKPFSCTFLQRAAHAFQEEGKWLEPYKG